MADYKQMYRVLFGSITEAIEILQEAQRQCEEMYMAGDPPPVSLVEHLSKIKKTTDSHTPSEE